MLFITVTIAGTFAVELMAMWLRNRREERANAVREAERTAAERYDRERSSWLAILAEKDRQIETLNGMVQKLEKNYSIATRVLTAVDEKKGEAA